MVPKNHASHRHNGRNPYDETAPTLYGTGVFVQCVGVDRYHFNQEGRMYEGETLYDIFEATQAAGILPRDDSRLFRALMKTTKLAGMARKLRQRVPFPRGD